MIYQFENARLRHGDVMDGIDELMQGETVEVVYTDPPWGLGNLKYWQTINKRMTGAEPKEVNYDNFISQIFNVATKHCTKHLFVEYGIKWRQDIKNMAASFNWIDNGTVQLLYRAGSKLLPLDLHLFSKVPVIYPEGYIDSLTNTYGPDTLKKALDPIFKTCSPGAKVLDPCCGMGYTAQISKDNGLFFFGNELNEKRLQKTINRFS